MAAFEKEKSHTINTDGFNDDVKYAIDNLPIAIGDLKTENSKLEKKIKTLEKFKNYLEFVEDNYVSIKCANIPIAADNFIVDWIAIEHYQEKPYEREIGRGKTPGEAIQSAIIRHNSFMDLCKKTLDIPEPDIDKESDFEKPKGS